MCAAPWTASRAAACAYLLRHIIKEIRSQNIGKSQSIQNSGRHTYGAEVDSTRADVPEDVHPSHPPLRGLVAEGQVVGHQRVQDHPRRPDVHLEAVVPAARGRRIGAPWLASSGHRASVSHRTCPPPAGRPRRRRRHRRRPATARAAAPPVPCTRRCPPPLTGPSGSTPTWRARSPPARPLPPSIS
jgi:hypothetical protein